MKTPLALAALVAVASSSIACTSPTEKEDVDTDSALSALRTPTGTFSAETAGKAFGGYRGQKANASKVSAPGVSGSGTSATQSIRLLDLATSSQACRQGQACACPTGGSMSYAGSSTGAGLLVKVTFDACVFEDGFGFDGKAVLLASKTSLLGVPAQDAPAKTPAASSTESTPGALGEGGGLSEAAPDEPGSASSNRLGGYTALLVAAKGTATKGNLSLPLEFALVTEAHYAFLAVKVADGTIIIGVSDDGRAIVKSKHGTWKCQSSSGRWSCTSERGESMDVTEEVAEEGAVLGGEGAGSAAPSAPSAPSDAVDF